MTGGGRGIRTPGTLSGTTVFKTAGINRSPIPPRDVLRIAVWGLGVSVKGPGLSPSSFWRLFQWPEGHCSLRVRAGRECGLGIWCFSSGGTPGLHVIWLSSFVCGGVCWQRLSDG